MFDLEKNVQYILTTHRISVLGYQYISDPFEHFT